MLRSLESLGDVDDGWKYGCDGNDPSVNGDKSRRFGNVVVNVMEVEVVSGADEG